MPANPGHLPHEATGKRVCVTLANGLVVPAPGWPADGKGECRWSLTGSPFDIKDYEVIR